jgi:hypothetical protein
MIYFIQQGKSGPIKIGESDRVSARLSALQTSNPVPLRCLGILTRASSTEKSLHTRFQQEHLSGEWFSPSKRLLKYIEMSTSPFETTKRSRVPKDGLSPLGDPITWQTESCIYVRF